MIARSVAAARGVDGRGAGSLLARAKAFGSGKLNAGLAILIYLACLATFITDLLSADTVAFGVFYVPMVATAVFYANRRAVWVLAGLACVMVIVGTFLPRLATDVTDLMVNRILSLFAILATAAFTWHARRIQDRLADQTRRAEAAERLTQDVLTNLSQEIRAPLRSMIGVLELLAVDGRADQQAVLGMVRSSGRRLVTTVDNLVDLTQFDAGAVRREPIDLGRTLRATIEAQGQDAIARQITLVDAIGTDPNATVTADAWALRRILENTIADTISHTAPGGRITVGLRAGSGHRVVEIATSGTWPPAAFEDAADLDRALLMPSAMGLALSQRLARAMDTQLVFASSPEQGTTIRLRLPVGAA